MKTLRGFTAIELMLTVAILAILLAVSLPSFRQALESRRAQGAANTLFADIQIARAESLKQHAPVYVSFSKATWCYGVSTNAACDCAASPGLCNIRTTSGSGFPDIVMQTEDFASDTLVISPVRGTTNPGTVTFATPEGKQYSVIVNGLGRARICQPGASSGSPTSC